MWELCVPRAEPAPAASGDQPQRGSYQLREREKGVEGERERGERERGERERGRERERGGGEGEGMRRNKHRT